MPTWDLLQFTTNLIDFFIHLSENRKFSIPTIEGYRSAIFNVLGRSFPQEVVRLGEVLRVLASSLIQTAKPPLPK